MSTKYTKHTAQTWVTYYKTISDQLIHSLLIQKHGDKVIAAFFELLSTEEGTLDIQASSSIQRNDMATEKEWKEALKTAKAFMGEFA